MTERIHNPEIVIEDGLIKVHENNAPLIFSSEDSILQIVALIRKEVSKHEPDLSTAKGRKAIASTAMKVSKSKVILDALGKDLVTGMKEQCKVIDSSRKVARDMLDELRDETRKPLTDYEIEQEKKAEAELLKIRIAQDHEDALAMEEVIQLRITAEKQQAEIDRLNAEQREKEAAEERERNRLIREEQIRANAEIKAKQDAEDEILRVKAEAEQKIRDAADQAEREKERSERQARIEASNAAAAAEAKRQAEEAIANNKRRQGQINRVAAEAIEDVLSGYDGDLKYVCRAIVKAIAKNQIPNVTINY